MSEIEPGYDIEALIPDWQVHVGRMGAESERVRQALPGRLDVAYGPEPLQRLDLFAPAAAKSAPVQLYIHGGAWKGSDKAGRAYPAEVFVAAGAIWAPINYRLAPAASLDQIVDDVRLQEREEHRRRPRPDLRVGQLGGRAPRRDAARGRVGGGVRSPRQRRQGRLRGERCL
jgi:hypothetical protein